MAAHKLILAVLFVALLATPSSGAERAPDDGGSPEISRTKGRLCGTAGEVESPATPPFDEIRRGAATNSIASSGSIPVNFHVIHNGPEGNVPEAWLDAQIEVLNRNYGGRDYDGNMVPGAAGLGYTFFKNSVTRTDNRQWFRMSLGSRNEVEAKTALVRDPTRSLNFYTCKPGQNFYGWSTFPWGLAAHPNLDGVVVHYASLPGGDLAPYNLGGTGTHEVGHWIGLLHTFQGGCYSDESCATSGDMVCDTPAEGNSTAGCPSSKDSCSGTGADPIHNYMDYSADVCYDNFTPGQDARADFMMTYYRPEMSSIIVSAVAPVSGTGRSGASFARPNPFRAATTIHFEVERDAFVSLRIFDLAGRLVTTLVDGRKPAGSHEVVFDGGGLPNGVYFHVLNDGKTVQRNRLLLIR